MSSIAGIGRLRSFMSVVNHLRFRIILQPGLSQVAELPGQLPETSPFFDTDAAIVQNDGGQNLSQFDQIEDVADSIELGHPRAFRTASEQVESVHPAAD